MKLENLFKKVSEGEIDLADVADEIKKGAVECPDGVSTYSDKPETKKADKLLQDITPEIRQQISCADARAYARKLRRNGIDHGVIVLKVREVWGEEVAKHVEKCKGGYYYLPDEQSEGNDE